MTSRYNIIRLAADYPVGGKPTYGLQPNLFYLSREQTREGHAVKVIARRHAGQPSRELVGSVEVYRVSNPFNINAFLMAKKLYGKKGEAESLIHTHSTSGVFAGALKRPIGLPLFSHVHGASRSSRMPQRLVGVMDEDFSATKMWYYYFRERLFWSSADCLLSVSDALKRDLVNYYGMPKAKVSVVYNGVDADLFRRRLDNPMPEPIKKFEGKKIVLYVGHFGPRKGIIFLIRAMKEVIKEVPDAVAVCIGGVPGWLGKKEYWSYLQNEIKQNDLEGKMLLLEKVPNNQLPAYYSRASVFALPSFYEAFAKVVLEAMSCEAPMVITREGGPREAVREGKTGYLVDFGSSEELAAALVRVLQDEGRAREMGREARRRVEKDFTWQAVARRINVAYDGVFQTRKRTLMQSM